MGEWVAAIAVIVGGTGVAGIIAGGLQVTERARVRRSIETLARVRKELPDGPAKQSIEKAMAFESLRLSTLSLRRRPISRWWGVIGLMLGGFGVSVAMRGSLGSKLLVSPSSEFMGQVAVVAIGYCFAALGFALLAVLIRDQERHLETQLAAREAGVIEEDQPSKRTANGRRRRLRRRRKARHPDALSDVNDI